MKKVLRAASAATITGFLSLLATTAGAVTFEPVKQEVKGQISTDTNIIATAFTVINWVLIATGAAAVLMLIIGGFRYITSAGNETQADAAKSTMTYAIMGLVFVLLAFVIAATINNIILTPAG